MPISVGSTVPAPLAQLLAAQGISGPCLVAVVKEGCGACEDALPLLDAAADVVGPILVVAQEDAATTAALRAALAPELAWTADAPPYAVSRALDVVFTPTLLRLDHATVMDRADGFDPDALHRMLAALNPGFALFGPGEVRPHFRPG